MEFARAARILLICDALLFVCCSVLRVLYARPASLLDVVWVLYFAGIALCAVSVLRNPSIANRPLIDPSTHKVLLGGFAGPIILAVAIFALTVWQMRDADGLGGVFVVLVVIFGVVPLLLLSGIVYVASRTFRISRDDGFIALGTIMFLFALLVLPFFAQQSLASMAYSRQMDELHDESAIATLAVMRNDPSMCASLQLSNECIIAVAVASNDSSICAQDMVSRGTDPHDICYGEVALQDDNRAACMYIVDNENRLNCLTRFMGEFSLDDCSLLPDRREFCEAIVLKNASACAALPIVNESAMPYEERMKMQLTPYLQQHRDFCQMYFARLNSDAARCSLLSHSYLVDSCVAMTKTPSVCDRIVSPERRSRCLTQMAISGQDVAICDRMRGDGPLHPFMVSPSRDSVRIESDTLQYDCRAALAEASGDVTFCPDAFPFSDSCVIDVAAKLRDPALCERTSRADYRRNCLGVIAALERDN